MTFSFGGCTEGIEYFNNTDLLTFADAQAACVVEGGKLAIPFSADRVDQMNDLTIGASFFVGLQDFTESGSLSGRDFLDIDGQVNPFTFLAGQGNGIWASGQPDNGSGSEHCVAMIDSEIQDVDCDVTLPSICQRFCESPIFLETDFDGCLNATELYIRGDDLATSYDEAQAHCQSVDVTGNLATPVSDTELARVFSFFVDKEEINSNCYLGFRDFQESGSATSTDSFVSVLTGEVEAFTNVGRSNFPWFNLEPNNGGQYCVEMRKEDSEFFDTFCARNRLYMCERSCEPTSEPTTNPTIAPTSEPTIAPTSEPTITPTSEPTTAPTSEPTTAPTSEPTKEPTSEPTKEPTAQPTKEPTIKPTSEPTATQTDSPSPPVASVESSEDSAVFMIIGAIIGICALFALVALVVVYRRRKTDKAELDDIKEKLSNYPDASNKPGKVTPGNSKYRASGGLDKLELQNNPLMSTPPISSSSVPAFTPIVTTVPIIASSPPKEKVDEDILTLDALVAANTNKPKVEEIDEDVLALDAIVAANTKPKKAVVHPAPDVARPQSAYLDTAQLKPEGRRSIFAPSTEFMNKAAEAKAKKEASKQDTKEDDLDI